jgi:hypothetical protein
LRELLTFGYLDEVWAVHDAKVLIDFLVRFGVDFVGLKLRSRTSDG